MDTSINSKDPKAPSRLLDYVIPLWNDAETQATLALEAGGTHDTHLNERAEFLFGLMLGASFPKALHPEDRSLTTPAHLRGFAAAHLILGIKVQEEPLSPGFGPVPDVAP